ncbi:hypothetical protein PWG15_24650 (plasmid) [Ensifer adhaerens]|uniref:hypothetical protein n=1 Tax=Ensifer adhaerens TaxID=106592 RepID=UPI0023A9FF05|nr:hypothetical protein [Ensifer adhaerens]WDZ80945.1 hypothetical protein PWG15_24650 [Ensifer adhaerens]
MSWLVNNSLILEASAMGYRKLTAKRLGMGNFKQKTGVENHLVGDGKYRRFGCKAIPTEWSAPHFARQVSY